MPGVSSAVLFESCQRNNNQNFFHKNFTGKYFLYIQIVFFSLMVLCYTRVQHIQSENKLCLTLQIKILLFSNFTRI